ncbi:hypothetical protein FNH22_13095 [Fulvivirga sp. M361]|uniref:DUF4846 domain-containing protein n=1 Tax=Fulvivirga sp. M361 TaxID=2594266 RepID=UPI00117BCC47|nr:DUF4846 domain-containing protein [Fulvivirga sp. M361]TRX58804.1 hypothetical protein FNH22_13095 [Fulvivirga sp. M361]
MPLEKRFCLRGCITVLLLCSGCFVLSSCLGQNANPEWIHEAESILEKRIIPPKGYQRIPVSSGSFAHYLRTLPLKSSGNLVYYYNGLPKVNRSVYAAVVDMELDQQDLQQCADAVMRLRGEYLYKIKDYSNLHFDFVSDSKSRYYTTYVNGDYSYPTFRKYMRYIFSYANTRSLHNEMKPRDIMNMEIGDVLIQKKNPYGHAVIVVDMAINPANGKKVYLLAQSYMPAQDTQILLNPMNDDLSPWYELNSKTINTPEWTFTPQDLRHFE